LPIISLPEQQRIVELLDAEFAKIDAIKANAEQQLQAAKDLFQAALKEMLTPKEGWKSGVLGDIATILHGKNQKEVISEQGKYPIYGSGGNIMGYASEYLCDEGTTILGRKGTINNPIFINEKFWNVDTAFGIIAQGADKKFLYYRIKHENWQERNTGTTLPSLTQSVVLSVPIWYPSIDEQKVIADKLDAISDKVKALQSNYDQTLTLCNDLKQALLKSIFE
jgi:type I restriction enzyme S subunit